MVGQVGNRLSNGGEFFRLQCALVKLGVFDGQGGLVTDGNHHLEVFFVEDIKVRRFGLLGGSDDRIDVEDSYDAVSTSHRNTDGFANPACLDARARTPTLIILGVAGKDSFFFFQHVIEDRFADGDLVVGLYFAILSVNGGEGSRGFILEHHASVIALHPLENQIDDLFDQLVDVESSTHGQACSVHNFPMGFAYRQGVGYLGVEEFGLPDRIAQIGSTANLRAFRCIVGNDGDTAIEIIFIGRTGVGFVESKHEDELANLNPIAISKYFRIDRFPIDDCAIAALKISQQIFATEELYFGVFARRFGIVKMDIATRVPSDSLFGFRE